MDSTLTRLSAATLAACALAAAPARVTDSDPRTAPRDAVQRIDLAERLAAGKLRAVNRQVSRLQADRDGVHVSESPAVGVVWIEGTDFGEGTIELDVRGRDVAQRSYLGVAFHRTDDTTYESVFLRPFNFRIADATRRQHAVQYVALPEYDWPRLRREFPEEFENPVDQSLSPADWVPLRLVVSGTTVRIHVGAVTSPTLEVRKLQALDRGMIGLWTGNNSDGDFANLRITPAN